MGTLAHQSHMYRSMALGLHTVKLTNAIVMVCEPRSIRELISLLDVVSYSTYDCRLHVPTRRPPLTRIRVRCYPGTASPHRTRTRMTRSSASSDTTPRPCRIPMLMGVQPPIENQTSRPGTVFFSLHTRRVGYVYTIRHY